MCLELGMYLLPNSLCDLQAVQQSTGALAIGPIMQVSWQLSWELRLIVNKPSRPSKPIPWASCCTLGLGVHLVHLCTSAGCAETTDDTWPVFWLLRILRQCNASHHSWQCSWRTAGFYSCTHCLQRLRKYMCYPMAL